MDEASPVCAGPTEPCYHDTACLDTGSDATGGLGCNAGGVGQICRFCGFEPFGACPGRPKSVVVLATVVAGTVDTFDQDAYTANLISTLPAGSESAEVYLNVTAASVRVIATIVLPEAAAQAAQETLSTMDAASLSSALGVSVAYVEHVAAVFTMEAELSPTPAPPPSPMPPSPTPPAEPVAEDPSTLVAEDDEGSIVLGASIGGAALLCIVALFAIIRQAARGKKMLLALGEQKMTGSASFERGPALALTSLQTTSATTGRPAGSVEA